jgi:hypothetical protein
MITVFEHIPDIFVEHYDKHFQTWGREFRTRGRKVAIAFDLMPGEAPKFDAEDRFVWVGAWFLANVETVLGETRVIIRPASDHDRHLIEEHCWKLKRYTLQ